MQAKRQSRQSTAKALLYLCLLYRAPPRPDHRLQIGVARKSHFGFRELLAPIAELDPVLERNLPVSSDRSRRVPCRGGCFCAVAPTRIRYGLGASLVSNVIGFPER